MVSRLTCQTCVCVFKFNFIQRCLSICYENIGFRSVVLLININDVMNFEGVIKDVFRAGKELIVIKHP